LPLLHSPHVGGYKCGDAPIRDKSESPQLVLINPTKSTLKQQPTISMGTLENRKPNKEKGKNGWTLGHIVDELFHIHEDQ
jgi:hypothetical protein